MRKLKITQGEAIVVLGTKDSFAKVKIGNRTLDLRTMELPSTQYKSENANAQLIADSFNTANKCDMLPSELANKYENLLQNISRTIADLVVEKEKQLFIIGNDSDLDKIRVATEQKIGLNFAISYLNDMLEFDKNN